jgi:Mce-associated membrane protein
MAEERSWREDLAELRSGTTAVDEQPTEEAPPPPDEPESEAEHAEPSGPRRSGTVLAVVLAVVFFLLSCFLMFVAASLNDQLDDERDVRADVEDVAGRFSEALLTYDFNDLDATRDKVLALSTGTFATEYEEAFPGLAELIAQSQSSASATVKDVFVSRIDGDRATAITVVDAVGNGTGGPRSQPDSYVRLDLVRTAGGWMVDGVTSLNFTSAPADDAGTTTTTVPAGG